MNTDKKMLLTGNYDLWCYISDQELDELDFVHHFIVAGRGDYIHFEAFNHNKLYYIL